MTAELRHFIVHSTEDGGIKFTSDYQKALFHMLLKKYIGKDLHITVDPKLPKRSSQQNRALHLWFDLLAQALNAGGYTVQLVLKERIDLEWDELKVKELLWRPAQKAILNKSSTTELRKSGDIDIVWEHLNRYIAEKFHIHVPFPNEPDRDNAILK